jgi:hypothetical protein
MECSYEIYGGIHYHLKTLFHQIIFSNTCCLEMVGVVDKTNTSLCLELAL